MNMRRYEHTALLPRIWELRDNLRPYDAAYIALAETLQADLVTVDRTLAAAPGTRCRIRDLRSA
nr:hypothetical protein [Jiangella gansuensis]